MVPSVAEQITELSEEVERLRGLLSRHYLTAKEVRARYGWSRTTFWRKRPALPQPRAFPGDLWLLSDLVAAEEMNRTAGPG